jgi:hypothetical protein
MKPKPIPPCIACGGSYDCSLCEFNPDIRPSCAAALWRKAKVHLARNFGGNDPGLCAGRWILVGIVACSLLFGLLWLITR